MQMLFEWKSQLCYVVIRLTGKKVALKEIRLQPEEGTPFTAIREGLRLLMTYLGK